MTTPTGTPAPITTELDGLVATIEIHRPPNNFFDEAMIGGIADALDRLAAETSCRAVVLCSEGKHFCAGADFAGGPRPTGEAEPGPHLYDQAVRIFQNPLPIVAAVQGAAIGGGLGLALSADFRVASPASRWSANFARLGFHHGFALSATLPRLVGQQQAARLLFTGERLDGASALELGLCDELVPEEHLRPTARALADQIAGSAPLAVRSIRETLRADLVADVRRALVRERAEQDRLQRTDDFREGVAATAARREPDFHGR